VLEPPPPTARAETFVTPAGATHVYVPGEVYVAAPTTAQVVILLLEEL
jgi:hypothetical protein